MNAKKTLTGITITLLAFTLAACSNGEDKSITRLDKPTPTPEETASPMPTIEPDVTMPTEDVTEATEGRIDNIIWGDEEDLVYTYEGVDLVELYGEELASNFESDMNNITHLFWSGSFEQFIGSNDTPDNIRSVAVREYMTDEMYNAFLKDLEDDNAQNISSVMTYTNREGKVGFFGEEYQVVDSQSFQPVFFSNTSPEVLVTIDANDGALLYERYINVRYFTESGEQIIAYMTITYEPVPGDNNQWVFNKVYRHFNDVHVFSEEDISDR